MADPTIFEWQIQDDQGLKNRIRMYVSYNGAVITPDVLQTNYHIIGNLIDDCIDGMIVEGRITIPIAPDAGYKAAPTAGNNVNQVMVLNFENDFNRYLTDLLLPSYAESTLDANGDPDLADPAIGALVTEMLSGIPNAVPTTFPNSRDLHDLDAVREAFLTVRKVRNQKATTRVIP